jgi:uncharacterized protein DUF1573
MKYPANRLTSLLVPALLLAAHQVYAGLTWEQTQLELHPAAGDPTAVANFKYQNSGKQVVHFTSIHPSCGCTTATLKKDDVAPGEAGEITATFKVGSSTGIQQKTVRVETDDPEQPVTILTLRAVIPQLVEVRPSFIFWQSSEPANPKTIVVKTAKELNAKNLNVSSSTSDFTSKVVSSGTGEFKIEVTPHDTSHSASATLTIQPDNGGKPVYATARVVSSKS